jgi:lysozyme
MDDKPLLPIKSISPKGLRFIIHEEGCILHPYLDSVRIPTIGVGNTYYVGGRRVTMQDPPITQEYADFLFKNILLTYEKYVWSVTRRYQSKPV